MKKQLQKILWVLCLYGTTSLPAKETSDICHTFLVQVHDKNEDRHLSEEEKAYANQLAEKLSEVSISAIYSSDELSAIETAEILAKHHHVEVIITPTLRTLTLGSLLQRVGTLRTFGIDLVEKHRGSSVIVVTHESLVRFTGRYVSGGFKKPPLFSFIEIDSDGRSMYLAPS